MLAELAALGFEETPEEEMGVETKTGGETKGEIKEEEDDTLDPNMYALNDDGEKMLMNGEFFNKPNGSKPQIQEEMTTDIANELVRFAKTPNVAVVVKAEHHCMTHRGVKEHESDMTTAIMLGAFNKDPALKKEFYDICLSMKGHGK